MPTWPGHHTRSPARAPEAEMTVPAVGWALELGGRVAREADEGRGPPTAGGDRSGLQSLAGVTGRDVLAVAQVAAHVAGPPHEVTGAGLGGGDHGAGVALGTGAARDADPGLLEDVPGEPGAVEAGGAGATVDEIGRAHV